MAHLGMTKGSDATLKGYAQRLANDHSEANTKLEAIASKNGIVGGTDAHAAASSNPSGDRSAAGHGAAATSAAGSSAARSSADAAGAQSGVTFGGGHDSMDSHLSGLNGTDFDRAFAKQMVQDHEQAIAKFEAAQQEVTDTEVRGFIAATLPTLREHLKQARDIQAGLEKGK